MATPDEHFLHFEFGVNKRQTGKKKDLNIKIIQESRYKNGFLARNIEFKDGLFKKVYSFS